MNKLFIVIFSVLLGAIPGLSLADHHLVFIRSVVKLGDTSCAVELQISGDDQNGFETLDAITLDGQTLVGFTELVNSGINNDDANNDAGDRILAASAAFVTQTSLAADLLFDDAACASFDADAVVSFIVSVDCSGAACGIDSIDASEVSGFGEDSTAVVQVSPGSTPVLVDLTADTLTVQNNTGSSVVLGTDAGDATSSGTTGGGTIVSGGNDNGGGCSLNPYAAKSHKTSAAFLLFSAAAIFLFRRLGYSRI